MKTIADFLSELGNLDIKLWVSNEDGRLRCNAPQGVLTADIRVQLAERKAEIITFLQQGNIHSSIESISLVARDADLPLSFAQARLWFLNQLEGETATYNIPETLHLTGSLNVAALEMAVQEIVQRHEILRTTFLMVNGSPVQVIADTTTVNISVVDWRTDRRAVLSLLEESSIEVRRWVKEEIARPFDLSNGPLLRVTVLRLSEQSHVLVLVMHHIISDGWSLGIFFQELAALYTGNSSLPPLPLQYADFASWQRRSLNGEVLQTKINYWKKQLAGAPPLLELPTDYPRPSVQTFHGSSEEFQINQELTAKLKTLSQQSGTTLFMTLLAVFATLLSRYSRQEDIVIGSPIANRNQSELESLIGLFVNTLVLRTQIQGNPTFLELLEQVRETTLEAYAHQDLPFEKLVEELQPQRSLSYSPLFQVMFVLRNTTAAGLEIPGLSISPFKVEEVAAQFDLTLAIEETESGLLCGWEYNTDLFETATIQRMAEHFQILLAGIVANPKQRVAQLPLLSQAEQHIVLSEWNNTKVEYPLDKCIHQLFEEQVERTPDAIAVVFESQQLTYRELNCRANQLARYLQSLGAAPEVLVGICVERSLLMVIGLLAILKTGSAYVPLDPAYPQERLAFMLSDSDTPLLLTQQHLREQLPEHQACAICLDSNWELIATQSQENLNSGVIDNLAYVIYTSGSTGKPKGAMNTHRGVVNRLLWMQDAYQLTASDRVLQKTPFSFDVSVWEFFWTLLTGACLVVAKPGGHQDSAYLVKLIAEQKITTLHFVPSMLQVFLNEPKLEQCNLRQVICSGEALPFELKERFFSRLQAQLHNLYGPTEAAIDVTYWQCKPKSHLSTVPIGRPIANIQLYILDQYLQPVPIGVPGELHIGGVGLARGYLKRPELTQQKFIPNPFKKEDARLYKTGDLVRYLKDGNIEYLGRLDDQVKIRGFRIELGEVEAMLSQHPQVRETVVLAEDQPGNKRLVAYIVPHLQPPTTNELRVFLLENLPDYMVPSAFVVLESLPLTPNGKVNRKALSAIKQTLELEGIIPPRTPVEEILVSIWTEILGIEKIGIYHNFFELGGHSLLATQVISRIHDSFLIELPLRTLFEKQTIADLAQSIVQILIEHTEMEEIERILAELEEA